MDYNEIKQIIDDNIKPNTNQDITAIVANLVMTGMIDYTRDSITDIVNQGFGAGAFTWLNVEHGSVIPYPQMSAGRARVVRILKDNVEYEDGEATIGGVNGVTIKRHALVICLEATNESANDGMQETVGDRFAVIQYDNEIIFTLSEPTQGVENKLYINLSSGTMKVWHNGSWIDLTFSLTTSDDGDIEFTGDGTPANPLHASVANKIPYKTIDTSVTEPDLAQLNAHGTDRVDFPNLNRIYLLNGAKWTYVETIDL